MESGKVRARWMLFGALLLGAADLAFLNLRLAPEYEAEANDKPGPVASHRAAPSTPSAVAKVDPKPPPANTAPAPTSEPPATAPPATTEPPVATAPPVATTAPAATSPPATSPASAPEVADIYFDFSKYEINLAAKKQLEIVAQELKSNSALRVHIRGHSDKLGGPAANLTLSGMRARSVKYYLTVIGVADDRITTEALGDTEPADPEDSPVAWARNSRVQIVWR